MDVLEVFVNGERREVPAGTTLAELLAASGAPGEGVAIEVNRALVRRGDHERRALATGDRVEIVGLVGGG
jgi:sulfur carrier protein